MTSEISTRREMLALGGIAFGATLLGAVSDGHAAEKHQKIHAAIHELREAHHYLKEAHHDFGGHRAKALELMDQTIHQLELCLKH